MSECAQGENSNY